MDNRLEHFGVKWYNGTDSLEKCLNDAKEKKHNFICAKDYIYINTDENGIESYGKPIKIYASYKTSKDFIRNTMKAEDNERNFYVIVPENKKCCLFNDIEWDLEWKSQDYIIDRYNTIIMNVMNKHKIHTSIEDFYVLSACDPLTNKGSLHIHNPKVCFNNISEQEIFMNEVSLELTDDDFFVQGKTKSINFKQTFIDMGIYNKNRCIRLPYSGKMKQDNITYRHFKPLNTSDYDFSYYSITDTLEADDNIVDITKFNKDVNVNKRPHSKNLSQIQSLLDEHKTDTIIGKVKGNIVQLKNKNDDRLCPLSNITHNNNNAYLVYKKDGLYFCCHSDHCKGKSLLLQKHNDNHDYEDDDNKIIHREPPFAYYYNQYIKNIKTFKDGEGIHNKKFYDFREKFMKDINESVVYITGLSEPYYLYRVYEEYMGKTTPIWKRKKPKAFNDSYNQYNIYLGLNCIFGVGYYGKSPNKKTYINEDCKPFEKKSEVPEGTFNIYDELFINKKEAEDKGKSDPTFILNFIKKSWANDNEEHYQHIIKWMAHLIQKPWIKMKSSLVLQGLEGCGKGMIIQILGTILGPKYFYQPTDISEVLGTFNYMLDNKLLVYANEMIWGGDKKLSGILKKLLTEERRTSNAKNMPQREMANWINWIFDSNESWVIPAGTRERRYNFFKVGNYIYTLTDEQVKSIYNFCPYSLANYLYNVDLTGFNPHKHINTIGLKEQKQLSMSPPHKFILQLLENVSDYFNNDYHNKVEIHEEFLKSSYCGSYHRDPKSFWMEFNKIFGELETKRRIPKVDRLDCINIQSQGIRVIHIKMPVYKTAVEMFNKLYDCDMVNVAIDE